MNSSSDGHFNKVIVIDKSKVGMSMLVRVEAEGIGIGGTQKNKQIEENKQKENIILNSKGSATLR